MTDTVIQSSTTAGDRRARLPGRVDLIALTAYLLSALILIWPLWRDLERGVPEHNEGDHAFFEFVLARAAVLVTEGGDPFFTTLVNAPLGVNLMANTSVLGLGLPVVPVTLLAGPAASVALVTMLGLALTAFGWYWIFSRHLVGSRAAAALGGLFCGFAPGIVTHAQGHPNWTAQFLVPFIVHFLFALRERPVRHGLLLAAVMVWQIFINEEVLFFTGLGAGVFGLLYALVDWAGVRATVGRFFAGLGLALAVTLAVTAYPLWVQFTGPGSYRGVPEFVTSYGNDVASFFAFSSHSLGASLSPYDGIAPNHTEENSFFGYPLILVLVVLTVLLRGRAVALAASVTAVIFAVLSVGRDVITNGFGDVNEPGPWEPLAHLPLFDSVVPTRLSLVMIPCIGAVLAIAADELRRARPPLRAAGGLVIAAALLPIVPLPLAVKQIPPFPDYITSGAYRQHLADGGTMLVVPGQWSDTRGMRWAARNDLDFGQPLGYFLGPDPEAGGRARYGPPRRATSELLTVVVQSGQVPALTEGHRADFLADLAFWETSVIVVPVGMASEGAVLATLTGLMGRPGTNAGGATVWDLPR